MKVNGRQEAAMWVFGLLLCADLFFMFSDHLAESFTGMILIIAFLVIFSVRTREGVPPAAINKIETSDNHGDPYIWNDTDDFVELWYAADELARERLRCRWRNQGLGMLA
jgi:hypothetical protein